MQIFVSEMKYLPIAISVSKNFRFFWIILIYAFQKSWTPIKNENHWILEIRYIKIEAFHKRLHCNLSPVMVQIFWQFHKFQCDEHPLVQNLSKLLGKVNQFFLAQESQIIVPGISWAGTYFKRSLNGLRIFLNERLREIMIKPQKKSSTISQNVQCNTRNRNGIWIAITKRPLPSFIPVDCCWSHSTFKSWKSETNKSPFFCNYSQLLIWSAKIY